MHIRTWELLGTPKVSTALVLVVSELRASKVDMSVPFFLFFSFPLVVLGGEVLLCNEFGVCLLIGNYLGMYAWAGTLVAWLAPCVGETRWMGVSSRGAMT